MRTKKMIQVERVEDIRPVDFETGKHLAIARDQMETCQCCGRKIVKIVHLTNGNRIGTGCAFHIERPDLAKAFKDELSKKQTQYLTEIGILN